ncbi:hypothetical protein GGF42_006542 [Coemansia sp. RSA 2424]|nr:hypothetical protein GGF42_006542 [Coemansia sp. RSA 2424]
MTCLGYSCPVYREFDPTLRDCCVSVHRSCYALLAGHLEQAEGSLVGGQNLLQRISAHIDSKGALSADSIRRSSRYCPQTLPPPQKASQPGMASKWLMCDPTDLPSIPTPKLSIGVQGGGERPRAMEIPWGLGHSLNKQPRDCRHDEAELYMSEQIHLIPAQLLTPPPSPTKSMSEGIEAFASRAQPSIPALERAPVWSTPVNALLHLPPHVLLSIVSHLSASDLLHLSQTCAWMRSYLSSNSAVWAKMCRANLGYTPKHLLNQQAAEYYLSIRGNHRLESLVLLQRERVEVIIDWIMRSK